MILWRWLPLPWRMIKAAVEHMIRRDICHKHHKQRLCKIIITRVKLHFVKVLLEQLLHV